MPQRMIFGWSSAARSPWNDQIQLGEFHFINIIRNKEKSLQLLIIFFGGFSLVDILKSFHLHHGDLDDMQQRILIEGIHISSALFYFSATYWRASWFMTSSKICSQKGFFANMHSPFASAVCALPLLLLPLFFAPPAYAGPAEDRLIKILMKGYNLLARPADGDQPVDVYFGMGLIQILQIIEVEQTVKANVWLRLIW